jgi:putative transposase
MVRRPRLDAPGAWFHVVNRGIARRVVFPDTLHVRLFLALLACAVRRGEIEVHVLCIMPTHSHLLVRSPSGRLLSDN